MSPYRITVLGQAVPARPGETLLGELLRAGLPFAFSCQTGNCGTCKCELVSGSVIELPRSGQALSPAERARGIILACRSLVNGDCELRGID
jgi:ferredoxin